MSYTLCLWTVMKRGKMLIGLNLFVSEDEIFLSSGTTLTNVLFFLFSVHLYSAFMTWLNLEFVEPVFFLYFFIRKLASGVMRRFILIMHSVHGNPSVGRTLINRCQLVKNLLNTQAIVWNVVFVHYWLDNTFVMRTIF